MLLVKVKTIVGRGLRSVIAPRVVLREAGDRASHLPSVIIIARGWGSVLVVMKNGSTWDEAQQVLTFGRLRSVVHAWLVIGPRS
jgi:hypothetical protein